SPRTRPRTWRLSGSWRHSKDWDLAIGLREVVPVVLGDRHDAPISRLALGALQRLHVDAHLAAADLGPDLVGVLRDVVEPVRVRRGAALRGDDQPGVLS